MSKAVGVLEDHEPAMWHAHTWLRKFTAADERDTMHTLWPRRSRMIDEAAKRGQLHRVPRVLIPHVECEQMIDLGIDPFATEEDDGNLLCNAGINKMEGLLIVAGGTGYNTANSALAVGDGAGSVPTPAATDTDLAAIVNAANRYIQVSDATFPTQATQVITFQSTFATGNGNFEWREWGVTQNTSSGAVAATASLLNHKGVDLGLKTSNASWAFKITITIS